MSANMYASCYGAVYTNWDTVRTHAAKAATTALAGNYDQAEGNFATSQCKKVAELMGPCCLLSHPACQVETLFSLRGLQVLAPFPGIATAM